MPSKDFLLSKSNQLSLNIILKILDAYYDSILFVQDIPYHLISMDFGVEMDGSQDFFQMFWPVVVSHKIDEKSPLYDMSARDIAEHTFEIILTMEGITPETGNTVQVGSTSRKIH